MAKTRLLAQTPQREATSPIDWERLAGRAILQAELAKDSRASAIRNALASGNAERMLKRLGIIGEIDIQREFPSREK
jgi:hypothetical protein